MHLPCIRHALARLQRLRAVGGAEMAAAEGGYCPPPPPADRGLGKGVMMTQGGGREELAQGETARAACLAPRTNGKGQQVHRMRTRTLSPDHTRHPGMFCHYRLRDGARAVEGTNVPLSAKKPPRFLVDGLQLARVLSRSVCTPAVAHLLREIR
eukprot:gene3584-biopygen21780